MFLLFISDFAPMKFNVEEKNNFAVSIIISKFIWVKEKGETKVVKKRGFPGISTFSRLVPALLIHFNLYTYKILLENC